MSFLDHLLNQSYACGSLIARCCQLIQDGHDNDDRALDADIAMDLHDLMCEQDSPLTRGVFGLASRSSSLLVTSLAFSAMILQEDFEMFFGAESPYVSSFMEFTERLRSLATPSNVETSRLCAAKAIHNLRNVFA